MDNAIDFVMGQGYYDQRPFGPAGSADSLPKQAGHSAAAHYDAIRLPDDICHFKKNETRKYRDAVCRFLQCKYEAIAPDGNCFFASVSACFELLQVPLTISATDLRARVVAWLVECKVRVPP